MSTSIREIGLTPKSIVPHVLPTIPLGCEKNSPPVHKPLHVLHKYRFWQPNAHKTTWTLVIDLDNDEWMMPLFLAVSEAGLPAPSWIIEKFGNGHGQAGWIIPRVSHGEKSHLAPQDFARDVRQALTNAFGGDQDFTNARCWNPFWEGWSGENAGRVMWGDTSPRSLGDLRASMLKAGRWEPKPPTEALRRRTAAVQASTADGATGRNVEVFNRARLRSAGSVESAAQAANNQLAKPLSGSELNGIIRSIEGYEARGRKGASYMTRQGKAVQAARGAKGGSKNTDAQQAARAVGPAAASAVRVASSIGRAAEIVHWHEQGLSRAQIMARMDVSEPTVKRALRAARNTP